MYARRGALLRVVAAEFNVPVEALTGGLSTHAVLPARQAAAALTVETLCPPFTRAMFADFFNISEGTLYRWIAGLRRREAGDEAFARRLADLRGRARRQMGISREDGEGSDGPQLSTLNPLSPYG